MSFRGLLLVFSLLTANSCLAAGPVELVLRALGPLPLSFSRPEVTSFATYQGATLLGKPAKIQRDPLIQAYVYSPDQFDDLAARYERCQSERENNRTLLLRNSFDEIAMSSKMDRIMREYLRRIYQGYSAKTMEESQQKQRDRGENLFDMGKNVLVNYQAFRLVRGLEARLAYDVVSNSARFRLVTSYIEGEVAYSTLNERSPASAPENMRTIDQAMAEFSHFDRLGVSLSHTFTNLGVRVKTQYGVNDGAFNYGFSKTIGGPFSLQILREENYSRNVPAFMAVQFTLGQRF